MISISSDVGLWIIEAYRRMESQLHVKGMITGRVADSAGVIALTSPIELKICLSLLDEFSGQNEKWFVSLDGAEFWFDPLGDPRGDNPTGFGKSRSALEVALPDGSRFLLVERFISPE